MERNVTCWLDKIANRLPDKIAFVDEKKSVTFRNLQLYSKAIASRIIQKGLFKKPIVIYIEKGVDTLVAFMGVAYSCNFYSPIDTDMPISRINKILEVLQPELVITTEQLKDTFTYSEYQGDFLLFEEAVRGEIDDIAINAARRRGIDTLMPNIKPISDLRNYTEVLREVNENNPVYLTKNGRREYAIVKMEELDKMRATIKLFSELEKGEESAREKGWLSADEVEKILGV